MIICVYMFCFFIWCLWGISPWCFHTMSDLWFVIDSQWYSWNLIDKIKTSMTILTSLSPGNKNITKWWRWNSSRILGLRNPWNLASLVDYLVILWILCVYVCVYLFALLGREISHVPEATKFATQILTFNTSRVIVGDSTAEYSWYCSWKQWETILGKKT